MWRPVVPIKLIYNHASTRKIDALVETGSDFCLFHSSIGEAIGIKIKSGSAGNISGVLTGPIGAVYYHDVKLVVGQDMVEIKAGFTADIVTPLLGQTGFFDNFLVTFDHHRIHRASTSKEFAVIDFVYCHSFSAFH